VSDEFLTLAQREAMDTPLDLDACQRRIYAKDAHYVHIVLKEVPLLLAEIKRLRGLGLDRA
jgi:hypothetical protein